MACVILSPCFSTMHVEVIKMACIVFFLHRLDRLDRLDTRHADPPLNTSDYKLGTSISNPLGSVSFVVVGNSSDTVTLGPVREAL